MTISNQLDFRIKQYYILPTCNLWQGGLVAVAAVGRRATAAAIATAAATPVALRLAAATAMTCNTQSSEN